MSLVQQQGHKLVGPEQGGSGVPVGAKILRASALSRPVDLWVQGVWERGGSRILGVWA